MLNRVVIMGRLVADPELRYTPSNVPVCTLRVAVDRKFVRQGEERETDFFDVVTWRQTAEFVAKYFTKGRMIAVDGHLQTRKWKDKMDQNRISVDIVADDVSFCGDKATGDVRREDTRYSEPPMYGAEPQYSAPAAPAASAAPARSSKLPPISDFSELVEDDDRVPF